MKKNFFQIIMGAVAVALGFTSCEKEKTCVKCINFNDKISGKTILCVGDQEIPSQEVLNRITAELKTDGYTVTYSEKCE